jgi:multiple sugar transport system permease protein
MDKNKFFKLKHKKQSHITVSKFSAFVWSIVRGVIIFGICFIILYPIFIKVSVSVMDERDLYDSTVKYIAKNVTLKNYKLAWEGMDYNDTFLRTFGLSFGTSVLQLIACLLTAYGFARFRFPGKNLLFGCVILTLIVPPQILMLPMFMQFRFFDVFGIFELTTGKPINLIDSPWPFLISGITTMGFKNGLYIYMLRQFFKGMPKELEEAAHVDGYGRLRTFIQIMLPSAKSMMVTIFLFGFVWQWTDSFYSGLYLPTFRVMSSTLTSLAAEVNSRYNAFGGSMNFISPGFASMMNNTGVVLVILPLIILYLICQRYFVESIERSGIVG